MANKEQKRTSREAKKPKQKKKDDKRPSASRRPPKPEHGAAGLSPFTISSEPDEGA